LKLRYSYFYLYILFVNVLAVGQTSTLSDVFFNANWCVLVLNMFVCKVQWFSISIFLYISALLFISVRYL
jgi:hypothetical protein